MNKETRGRKHQKEQTIEVWYTNEYRKLHYAHETNKISKEEFTLKRKELYIEKLQKEILEDLEKQ